MEVISSVATIYDPFFHRLAAISLAVAVVAFLCFAGIKAWR